MRRVFLLLVMLGLFCDVPLVKASECPPTSVMPHFEIDEPLGSSQDLVLDEPWQVLWEGVPISDVQLAHLAGDEVILARLKQPVEWRPFWVFMGLGISAFGTALSSTGWVLYGNKTDNVGTAVSLSLALSGMVIGALGVVMTAESAHRPLESFLTPVPRHHITRTEAQDMLVRVNTKMRQQLCALIEQNAWEAPKLTP